MTKALIMSLICSYSQVFGVDPKLALSVARAESNYNPSVIGEQGEIGLFQVMPRNFPQFSIRELKNPYTNTMLGLQMISDAKESCPLRGGINYLICYNYGIKNAKNIKHPEKFPYILKISRFMKIIQQKSCNRE